MKRVLFVLAFLFAVVCYAAPPPDVGFMPVADDEISVLQVAASEVAPVFIMFEAQEVAVVYLGDRKAKTGSVIAYEGNKNFKVIKENNNIKNSFLKNRQHSNYGYPFTAN